MVEPPSFWILHQIPSFSTTPKTACVLFPNSLQTHLSPYLEAWILPSMSKSENLRQHLLNWLNCCLVKSILFWYETSKNRFPSQIISIFALIFLRNYRFNSKQKNLTAELSVSVSVLNIVSRTFHRNPWFKIMILRSFQRLFFDKRFIL